jgi:hypothetical protein
MNNTEKKLDALIDALGFDVEEIGKLDCLGYAQHLMNVGGVIPVNSNDYRTTEFKFTKRDELVNHEWTVDANTSYAFDDELTVNLAATEAFKNVPCTVRTTIVSSTILKRELLKILETAGKKPKKETIAMIEHAIDKAFKS